MFACKIWLNLRTSDTMVNWTRLEVVSFSLNVSNNSTMDAIDFTVLVDTLVSVARLRRLMVSRNLGCQKLWWMRRRSA